MATLALHAIPLALLWVQWQQWRMDSAAVSVGRTIEVRLQTLPREAALGDGLAQVTLQSAEGAAQNGSGVLLPATFAPIELGERVVAQPYPWPPTYLSASELDIRPQPQAPLTIPFPESEQIEGIVSAVLTLYIGLEGKVENIHISDSTLPPEFERVAREAFMSIVMRPGFKEGQPMRSMMKVVVEFESGPAF